MKGIKRYLLYAIGEIILVVVGILIAVNINNANENHKTSQQLNTILHTYRQDLVTDTTSIAQNMRILNLKEEAFNIFLSDTLTIEDYTTNPLGYALTTTHAPFQLQERGINLLDTYTDNNTAQTDSLVIQIIAIHKVFKQLINDSQNRINKDLDDNLTYLKNNKTWLKDLLDRNITTEIQAYFVSDEYLNRLALHKIYVIDNFKAFLNLYKTSATDLIQSLDKRLKED